MPAEPSIAALPPITRSRARLDRWLHRFYSQSTGVHHFIARRLRPAGIGLGLVFMLATSLGIGQQRVPVYQLFSFCCALFLIGMPWAFLRRAKLRAERELPRFATAGKPVRYTLTVRNAGRRRLRRAWLAETPPDPRPDVEEFVHLREPGEEERNAFDRFFAYFRWQWLLLRRRLFAESVSPEELTLNPGGQTSVFIEMTPLRRGVIRLQDLRVQLPDPFGLFQRCSRVAAPAATLTVLPRRYWLPPIELPGGADFQITGESNTNAIGNSGEFTGLRDYRPGDPLRLIHWKSWARVGRPIVKELEDTFYPRYGLILDTLSADRSDVVFEEVVSVAASFAATIDTSDSLLELMFIKDEAHVVTAGRGMERAEKLLEVLAGVTPERVGNFHALSQLVLRHRDDLTSCLVILNGWDEERAEFLRSLKQGGVICSPIVIGHGAAPPCLPAYWLESGHVARDLKRLPARLSADF
jgi:uncharacterized protein (DUF58 family)